MTRVRVVSKTGQASLEDFLDFGAKLLVLSLDNIRTVLQQAPRLALPLPDLMPRRCECAIPETECPPRCVCEVEWEASQGETPSLTVRLTNSANVTRNFNLHATPFLGSGGSPGTLSLAPSTLTLAPGEAGLVNAKFTVPKVPDGDYDAEIVIQGAYEQRVCVRLRVDCKSKCGDEHGVCDVVQGNPPVRIRAHQWYHHFQCVEPCAEVGSRHPDSHN
jgi:hypothetical protein